MTEPTRPYTPELLRERICSRRDNAGMRLRIQPATPAQLIGVSDTIRAMCPGETPGEKTMHAVSALRWLFGHRTEMTQAEADAVLAWLKDDEMATTELSLVLAHPEVA